MKRKLVKQGGKAYTVTLPISWIRERGLEAGDEIDVFEQESRLILSSNRGVKNKTLSFSIQNFTLGMRYNYLTAAYLLGVDELFIDVDEDKIPEMNEVMGYTILDQKGSTIHVHDIGGNTREDLEVIFKRVFQILIRYFIQAKDDIVGKQTTSASAIRRYDHEINKLTFFLQRAVMKKTMSSSVDGKLLFAYSYALEKIGDEILRMWKLVSESKPEIDENLQKVFDLVSQGLELSFAVYYRFSDKNVKSLSDLKIKFKKKAFSLFGNDEISSRLLMHLTKIFDDSYDLTNLAIMREFNKK